MSKEVVEDKPELEATPPAKAESGATNVPVPGCDCGTCVSARKEEANAGTLFAKTK